MKKVMFMLATVACVAGLQAAVVNWGGAVDADAAVAGSTAYLLWADSAFTGDATKITGDTADNGGKVVSTYTLSADDASMWSFTASYSKPGESVDGYYAVIVAPSGTTSGSYMDLGQITGTTGASSATDLTVNAGWTEPGDPTITASGFNKVTISGGGDIPEPTSGLLLLFGGAMLALRRRRA